MSTILAHSSVNAFELARQKHQHQPYSSYAAAVAAAAVHDKSDSDSETASSLGDDFSTAVAPFKPSYVAPSGAIGISTKPRQPPQLKRSELVNVFAQAMSFLPLNDINNARAAGPVLAEAASWVAPQPFGRDDVSFVRWEPTVVPHPIKLPNFRRAAPGAPSNFSWRCLNCSHLTFGPRSCTVCQAPINGSSCRVFLGQLRKDLTAEVTSYMLRSVAPELNILHVESHTNPADGRGRGCAWVYVDSVEDAVRVTELHKRIFVDVDTEGNEGFWFVQDQALVPALSRMADVVGNTRGRPQILPRQPMVAELPAKSIIADIVNSMNAQH